MSSTPPPDTRTRLLPEGQRWGFGAHTVLPYLTMNQQARPLPAHEVAASIRNPVFPQMEYALGVLLQRH